MDTGEILEVFRYQYDYCPQYRRYVDLLGVSPEGLADISDIPFLPIRFFKQYDIISSAEPHPEPQKIFYSSSTTGQTPSRHCVLDISLYERSFMGGFRQFYGEPEDYVILALLPSYLEREGSSLVYMADRLIKESGRPESGYYLYDHDRLYNTLTELRQRGQRTLLLGVAFALLDFTERYVMEGPNDSWLTVMETGGMKGRREELTREELHRRLSGGFGVGSIHSEYGMCELLSQAYSAGDGVFRTPDSMKVIVKELNDPFRDAAPGRPGVINVIDLANRNSCSFIETEDVGRVWPDGSFTVDGRLKGAERRGCNMLIE
ncbi:MAG TPA: acyltransferase [Candidatus Coprenecus stercoravium]|uniref:Acyltransferase n=1 Tax=Candidatus Coprenecus stercoravium TaxID=2840735 RepID=A0A9D2K9Y3_9BACT|nr:acyltransferase [Candidatus Coprenecus stercoravium]